MDADPIHSSLPRIPPPSDIFLGFSPNIRPTRVSLGLDGEAPNEARGSPMRLRQQLVGKGLMVRGNNTNQPFNHSTSNYHSCMYEGGR